MSNLKDLIKKHEGFAPKVYLCPAKRWTIGYGRNVQDLGITQLEADQLLENDILRVTLEAKENFMWFNFLTPKRQDAVLCMIFQLGIARFKQFKKTIGLLAAGDYEAAANEALNSAWAKQTPERAREVSDMLR